MSVHPPNEAISVDFRPVKLQPEFPKQTTVAYVTFRGNNGASIDDNGVNDDDWCDDDFNDDTDDDEAVHECGDVVDDDFNDDTDDDDSVHECGDVVDDDVDCDDEFNVFIPLYI